MAIEHVDITPGTGAPIAADLVGTDYYQVVKIGLGADGVLDNVADAGPQAGAASLPVALSDEDNAVLDAIDTAVDLIAAAVVGTHMQADVLSAPAVRALTNADVVTAELSATDNAVLDTIDTAIDAINAKLVSGTVIGDVNLGATDNAVLDALATSLAIIDDWDSPADHCNIRHLNATDDVVALGAGTAEIGKLAAGTAGIGKLTANSGVNIGDVGILSVVPGVAATNLGKAEDAGHSSGDVGVMALAVRNDTPAALAAGAGDYIPLTTGKVGGLWTTDTPATPYKNIDCDESEDAISANPCILRGFYAYANVAAGTKRYLKLYNNTVAGVTVGTTVPDMTFELDGTQGLVWSTPLLFATALTIAATTGIADNDSGAPGANEVVFNCSVVDL